MARAHAPGVFVDGLTWQELEALLGQHTTVLLPLGARTKEHGPHLPLNNDWLIAEYLARRVAERVSILVLPTLQYGTYPAFLEYPGSVSIRASACADIVVDIASSFAQHGIRRLYVLNTGISTNVPLHDARERLLEDGIRMEFTDLHTAYGETRRRLTTQPAGTHADEIETSMMLYIAPEVVRMERAVRDVHLEQEPGGLTRDPNCRRGVYSPTGSYGDPTLATRAKGEAMVEAMVDYLVNYLERFVAE